MIQAKVIGACGYGGVGISELLHGHPEATIATLVDVENSGCKLSDLYPHLAGHVDQPILAPDASAASEPADVVFMATPDSVGMKLAASELQTGARIIDYSGDFRFNNAEAYAEYARRIALDPVHANAELLAPTVYGIPELHRHEVSADTRIIGNPGCFAVSCIMGLAPAVKQALIDPASVICDCKTGVSGAGRKPNAVFHYPARYDMMNAYKLAGHQHVCEIERELGLLADRNIAITFTAQVVPVCRGIMSTLYGSLVNAMTEEEVMAVYRDFYNEEPFVQVYPSTAPIGSMHVRGTNSVKLVVSVDMRTRRLRIVSYIDNLVKGQAGSALQNMNLLFGLDETAGLDRPGIYP